MRRLSIIICTNLVYAAIFVHSNDVSRRRTQSFRREGQSHSPRRRTRRSAGRTNSPRTGKEMLRRTRSGIPRLAAWKLYGIRTEFLWNSSDFGKFLVASTVWRKTLTTNEDSMVADFQRKPSHLKDV